MSLSAFLIAVSVGIVAGGSGCRGRGNSGYGGWGKGGKGNKYAPPPSPAPKPASFLDQNTWATAKPLLDTRASTLWEAFKDEATDAHKEAWAKDGHNSTSRLALAFRVVMKAADAAAGSNDRKMEVAVAIWNALPAADRGKHSGPWEEYQDDGVLLLALALKVLRSPEAEVGEMWLSLEERKGIYAADLEAMMEVWAEEGEDTPTTEEATRLLVGCMEVASTIKECQIQSDWARKCLDCEQEKRMRHAGHHSGGSSMATRPWLVAAVGVTATLAFSTMVCLVLFVRRKRAAATLRGEAPVWPESKASFEGKDEAEKVAEKVAEKLKAIEGAQPETEVVAGLAV